MSFIYIPSGVFGLKSLIVVPFSYQYAHSTYYSVIQARCHKRNVQFIWDVFSFDFSLLRWPRWLTAYHAGGKLIEEFGPHV